MSSKVWEVQFEIAYKGQLLPYSIFDKVRQVKQGEIVNNKRLGAALALAKEQQKERGYRRSKKAPHRSDQVESLFV